MVRLSDILCVELGANMIDEIMKHPDMEPSAWKVDRFARGNYADAVSLAQKNMLPIQELFTREQVALAVRMALEKAADKYDEADKLGLAAYPISSGLRIMAVQITPEPRDEYRTDKFYQTT
jgi:hypothetical protein